MSNFGQYTDPIFPQGQANFNYQSSFRYNDDPYAISSEQIIDYFHVDHQLKQYTCSICGWATRIYNYDMEPLTGHFTKHHLNKTTTRKFQEFQFSRNDVTNRLRHYATYDDFGVFFNKNDDYQYRNEIDIQYDYHMDKNQQKFGDQINQVHNYSGYYDPYRQYTQKQTIKKFVPIIQEKPEYFQKHRYDASVEDPNLVYDINNNANPYEFEQQQHVQPNNNYENEKEAQINDEFNENNYYSNSAVYGDTLALQNGNTYNYETQQQVGYLSENLVNKQGKKNKLQNIEKDAKTLYDQKQGEDEKQEDGKIKQKKKERRIKILKGQGLMNTIEEEAKDNIIDEKENDKKKSIIEQAYPQYVNVKNRPPKLLQLATKQDLVKDPKLQTITFSQFTATLFGPSVSSHISKQTLAIKDFFKNIDLGLNLQSVQAMAKNKLKLDNNQANEYVEQMWWGGKQLKDIGVFLRQRGIFFKQTKDSNTIYVSQRSSIEDYMKYGESISLIYYKNLVKVTNQKGFFSNAEQYIDSAENHEFENSSFEFLYDAYLFICNDWRGEQILLGTAVIKSNQPDETSNIVEMLQMFFGCMHSFVSNSFIFHYMHDHSMDSSENFIIYDHAKSKFEEALSIFCDKYECKIKLVENILTNQDSLQQKVEQHKLSLSMNKLVKQQVQEAIKNFKFELNDILTNYQEVSKGKQVESEQFISQPNVYPISFTVKQKTPYSDIVSLYNPQDPIISNIPESRIFTGFSLKIQEQESLQRKLYWIIKPFQDRPIQISQYLSGVFRLIRYLKKIGKEGSLDYRCDYRNYKTIQMYRLRKKLGVKIYNLLQKNYLMTNRLAMTEVSSTQYRVRQGEKQQQDSQQFGKCNIYTVKYLVDFDHWSCNCNRIYIAGVPCSHLLKVLIKHGGCIQYYINERWSGSKIERDRIKKFRKKQYGDNDS